MNKKFQIFISSTFEDLKLERQAAVEAILKCHHIPAGMELFSAGNESQLEVIKRWIDESDIYVLILGGRYGSIEYKTGLSYTEIEFDYAVGKGKPMFSVVLSEEFIEHKVREVGLNMMERDEPTKLKAFRHKVLSRICTIVSDCKDIRLAVMGSIPDLAWRNELIGWVRGDSVLKPESKSVKEAAAGNNGPEFRLIQSAPKFDKPIEIEDMRHIVLEFSNPIDRSTACFIGILNPHENCFYQLDSSGGIRYSDEDRKLNYQMSDPIFQMMLPYVKPGDDLYCYEIHLGRGHPDTLIKDVYGNILPHTIIPVFMKQPA